MTDRASILEIAQEAGFARDMAQRFEDAFALFAKRICDDAAGVNDRCADDWEKRGWEAKERGDTGHALALLGMAHQLKECSLMIRAAAEIGKTME